MKSFLSEIKLATAQSLEFIDITNKIEDILSKSGVKNGVVNIFTQHTTAAVKVNERCDRLQQDMLGFLETIVPKRAYRHDENTVDSRNNARSHLMSMLLGASETIPVSNGKIMLGTWQSIFFIELDGPRNNRSVIVKIMGE